MTVPAFRGSDAARRTCARDGCDEVFWLQWPSDRRRFHSHACAAASRRQDECGTCGEDDWIVQANGRRACRPCRRRSNAARDRRATTPTPDPAAPLPPPRPAWRPSAPGWPIRPGDEAWPTTPKDAA